MNIGLVTCRVLPEPDPDQEPLLRALRETGMHPELLPWDDPGADPAAYDVCLLRSCWNYYEDPPAFLDWIERAAGVSRVINDPETVRWNLHKAYLNELEAAGIPVVPTAWAQQHDHVDLGAVLKERGWNDVVIKPAVSAASFRTERFSSEQVGAGQAFLDDLLRDRDAMIQRYMPSVETGGERALVVIDGRLTHSVIKHPRFAGADESVVLAPEVTDPERDLATAALDVVNRELLYARVDIVADGPDRWLLSELELIEPSLFLVQSAEALVRLTGSVDHRLAG